MTLFRQNSALPNFLDSQRDSFRYFLETGIREELDFFSPIVGQSLGSSSKRPTDRFISVSFHSKDFYFKKPHYTPQEAVQKLGTYKSSLIVPVHVYSKYLNLNATFPVAFCDLPLMTEHGTFILNGSPRVIVHQIVRCPGVYLKPQFDKQGNRTHLVSFLSAYGSWLRFETDKKGVVFAHIDNLRKVPVTVFLQALGFSMDTIVGALKYPEALDPTLKEVDWKLTTDEAILLLMSRLFPNRPATVLRGRKFLFNQFFNPRRYSLSDVGRKRVNQKFRMRSKTKHLTLTPQDALAALDYLLRCENGETEFLDDIDHLKNRRARLAGELIQTQFRLGLNRLERVIYNRISDENILRKTPGALGSLNSLIRTQVLASVFQEFFGSNQLSQFMDQTNPLAEITHKRRLSSLGPGGLNRDRAGLIVRGIHPSYYGRICPIETPEGKNAGLVGSIATFTQINKNGFLESPYYKLISESNTPDRNGFFLLSAFYEEDTVVAQGDVDLSNFRIPTRNKSQFTENTVQEINFLGLCPIQFMSIATSLIPFLEHDDANRALMGSNMQRQAVSLLRSERPFVGTGLEAHVTRDIGATIVAKQNSYISYVDAQRIDYFTPVIGDTNLIDYQNLTAEDVFASNQFKHNTIWLTSYQRSNQDTCLNHKPLVEANTWVEAGDCLADNAATAKGELALGRNILIGYMPWEGYNFEDAVLVSERLVYDDVFTSIHISRYEVSTARLREGQEYFTNQVDRNQYLDEFGVVKIGTWVEAGDVLVGKISPQPDSDNDPESRLLRAIFGGVARNTKTTSYCLSSGVSGRILDVRCEFKRQTKNIEDESIESTGSVYVYLVEKRRLQVGDKVAGRHGNKGIVSNILPRVDMPYLQSGKALDMVLNPLGVPSRMNVGQIFECLLGLAANTLKQNFKVLPFDEMHGAEVSRGFVYHYLYKSRLLTQQKWLFKPNSPGKSIVFDGRTGLNFDQPVTVGYPYILKLVHLVDDKIHARSTGPYSLVTQQPLGGRSKKGGQRLGEMEVWALEGFGAAYVLQELLTIKSDDMIGRNRAFMSMIRGTLLPKSGIPESFKVLVSELRGLCLDMSIARINF
ncbi:RNA polymerase beta subunit (chloroplast) [Ostreococcus tauri]|jgi:DNA-directed RNA polymerase subunit beta|uniref:DNA-directed RNA polymerase subunit beta n=2 Tax=Ostreococcus tauri TaxID=70448 RepID=RPOB_OSTTA|nr:RNA polymerase beta subunit [Ostreococcus tauri]Q0P3M6.1 RecName: Full=DNA-directed RNA polymerase subunit beta; AltName: Full=PEP; AltName: Full=Plastid-encoded RNA polymerase subunit beta; Short=RNA polymerase subunit beta [Ostreococcus tauri]AGR88200.1 RNA polymerase beta subunit [Ostreococcus tauri]AGW30502.1 RNA polymerase beta subunit [Ostreococcus tauri]AGW30563.1 RNA polymerase beta subunit [Ostreococcus tauri]AGW30624.1 RNA polymerase beta subunit [Ostreococcus tauri]AGW30685.1 RN|eukprot:YP_717229.1 RpoB (chloroplast) [Ostreococcus tauri]